jgi:lysophospholipase L1-like esterase
MREEQAQRLRAQRLRGALVVLAAACIVAWPEARHQGPLTTPVPANEKRHAEFLEIARAGNIDLLFIGDSITDWWRNRGRAVWDRTWAPLQAANFGIAGERVEQLLWRVQNGALAGFQAKVIVLMIGTNNLRRTPSNDDIAGGIAFLAAEIHKRQPQARVLVLGIFPRDAAPGTENRQRIQAINAQLAKLEDRKALFYMDIGDRFLAPDGTIATDVMYDGLHPAERGYEIWAEAILPRVKALMGS